MGDKAMLGTIIEDAIRVITGPVGFYRDMKKTGGFTDPVIFVVVMAAIMGIAVAIFSLFGAGMVGAMAAGIGAIIILPVFAVIGSFIGAAIMFVIWKLMGSEADYETAYRCVAYAAAIYPVTAVAGLVPYLGSIIGVVWGFYLMIVASTEVHGLNQKTAYMVFGIFGALMVVVNVSNEMETRAMTAKMAGIGKHFEQLGKQFEQNGDMSSKEAGKAIGEFFNGMNEGVKQANQGDAGSHQENTSLESPPSNQGDAGKPMTPEESGKALGDFLKGFGAATQGLQEQTTPVENPDTTGSTAIDAGGDQSVGQ